MEPYHQGTQERAKQSANNEHLTLGHQAKNLNVFSESGSSHYLCPLLLTDTGGTKYA